MRKWGELSFWDDTGVRDRARLLEKKGPWA